MSGLITRQETSPASSSLDIVDSRIDIADKNQITTFTLQRCRKLVLSRYHKLLIFIAWKSFGQKKMFLHPGFWKFLNFVYMTFVMTSMFYSYAYEIMFCEGEVATFSYKDSNQEDNPIARNVTSSSNSLSWRVVFEVSKSEPSNSSTNYQEEIPLCHEITIYAIPNVLHLIAFAIGFWHFRIKENEELDALMERVFLQAQYMFGAQEKLIRNAKWFLIITILWSLIMMALTGLSMAAFGFPQQILHKFAVEQSSLVKLLASLHFIGKLYILCTYVAVIVNYNTQCEFLIYAIKSICLQLNERIPRINESMHDILRLRELISNTNGSLSKMTSICILNFALKVFIGVCILLSTSEKSTMAWIYRWFFPIVWALFLLFPLIQAARVTKTGEKLRQISFEIRIFGYKNCDAMDLDSFILFINNARLRTKLFSLQMKPSYLVSSFTVLFFTTLILFQTNVIKSPL